MEVGLSLMPFIKRQPQAGYGNITITKSGANLDTAYTVMPAKPAPINPVVKHHFEKEGITLESLCVGGNPFDGSEQSDEGKSRLITSATAFSKMSNQSRPSTSSPPTYPTAEAEGIDLEAIPF